MALKFCCYRVCLLLLWLLASSLPCRASSVVNPFLYDSAACSLYYFDRDFKLPALRSSSGDAGPRPDLLVNTQASELQITARGLELPPWLIPHLTTATDVMRDAWLQMVPMDTPPQTPVELVFVADRFEFESMRRQLAPQLADVSGFYSSHTGQVVVLYDARILESVRRTAIHEISHLLTDAYLGPAPVWLAEGLAEYYEPMYIANSGAALGPNRRHAGVLFSAEILPLLDFLQLSPQQWRGESARQHYATAWSFVFFLMDSGAGQKALQQALSIASENICKPLRIESLLGGYPGGFEQLDRDWQLWLRGAPFAVNQHMLRQPH
jgi:hypothetical protein